MQAGLVSFLAVLASSLTGVAALVRFAATWRSPSVSGLSAPFAWLGLVGNTGWVVFGLRLDVPAQVYPSVAWLAAFGYVLVRIHVSGRSQFRPLLGWLAPLVAMAACAWWAPVVAGFVAGFVTVGSAVPQLVRVWRTGDRAGVGPVAWWFSLALSGSWVLYGVAAGLPPVWVTNAVFFVLGAGVLLGYARARGPVRAGG